MSSPVLSESSGLLSLRKDNLTSAATTTTAQERPQLPPAILSTTTQNKLASKVLLTPATHSNMLSSRRWPADEARPSDVISTPTKRLDSANQNLERSELLGLDMSGFRIRNLPPSICKFTFLTELRLSNNFITSLPPGIGSLRSLSFLDLSSNKLSQLPVEIGWLTNLKELLLYDNLLQDLPGEMGYLYQMDNLVLEGNPLNENLLQIIHSQGGPLSVIPFLRDHMICTSIQRFIDNYDVCV